MHQHTLARAVRLSGRGLHSAREVTVNLRPAPVGTGLVLQRNDLPVPVEIPARLHAVSDATRATTLSRGSVSVVTVEHLLAALLGTAIDNAVIALDAPEVPIMDGSAEPFVRAILAAGLQSQAAPREFLRVKRPVALSDGDKSASFEPHDGLQIDFTIDFQQPVFRSLENRALLDYSPTRFAQTAARARTFGFAHELDDLQARGLALGGSTDNAVVLESHRIVNEEGLRCRDELVQHKVLDALGDLALAGWPIIGRYCAHKAGHALNHAALGRLLAARDAWEIVTFQGTEPLPAGYDELA